MQMVMTGKPVVVGRAKCYRFAVENAKIHSSIVVTARSMGDALDLLRVVASVTGTYMALADSPDRPGLSELVSDGGKASSARSLGQQRRWAKRKLQASRRRHLRKKAAPKQVKARDKGASNEAAA